MTRPSWWRRRGGDRPAERDVTGWLPTLHPCSCTGTTVIVLHDRDTPCGDQQHNDVAEAIAASDHYRIGDRPLADVTYQIRAEAALYSLTDSKEKP